MLLAKTRTFLRVPVFVLQSDFAAYHCLLVFFCQVNHVFVQDFLALVEVFYKRADAIIEFEDIFFAVSFVFESNLYAGIKVGYFADTFDKRIVLELDIAEDFLVGA